MDGAKTSNEESNAAHATQQQEHLSTKWQTVKDHKKIVGWIAVMVWILVIVGFDNQAGGTVISIAKFKEDFGYQYKGKYILEAKWQSALSGGPIAMNVLGILAGSWAADRIGKRIVLTLALMLSIGAIGIEFGATVIEVFFTGKMLNGIALGVFNGLCVSYVAEISPLSIRGVATGCCNLAQTIGPFIGSIMARYVSQWKTDWSYRSLLSAQWGFAAVAIFVQPFMPESPWYYLRTGRDEKALKSLIRLYGSLEEAEDHLAVLRLTLEEAQAVVSSSSYIDCFKGTNLRRTLIAQLAFITHPMSGVSFISSYGALMFQFIGVSDAESFRISVGAQVLSISGTVVSFFIVDRFGRRPLLIGGVSCLMILMLLAASTGIPTQNPHARLACVAFLTMFNFFYNGGIGAIAYTIASEIPTSILRTKTVAIAISTYQSFNTMWTFVLPFIINPDEGNVGAKVGFIFFGLLAICLVLVVLHVPEIAHRTYEELDELFGNRIPARKFKSYITSAQVRAEEAYQYEIKAETEIEHVEKAQEA